MEVQKLRINRGFNFCNPMKVFGESDNAVWIGFEPVFEFF
jgi:hypothetical protein